MRSRLKWHRPSPAMVVSVVALVFAVAGTAVAGVATVSVLNKKEKKQTRKIAKKEIRKAAPGLSVANAANAQNASTAENAGKLAGKEFVPLAFLAPKGTGNTLIGSIGPLQIYAACSAGGEVSVSAASSAGGSARFIVQGPSQSNSGGVGLSGSPNEFVSGALYDRSPAAFAYRANGRLINGHFMLGNDPGTINCIVSGDMAG